MPKNNSKTTKTMHTKSRATLLGLPVEIRGLIFEIIFKSTTIMVERIERKGEYGELLETPLSRPPVLPEKLVLVCHTFRDEIGNSWHERVTYHFPSTVAFIDVLSQWPKEKIKQMRHAHIVAYPLPIYHHLSRPRSYATYYMPAALPIFPGLQLDTLSVENIWLEPNGQPLDGLCLDAVRSEIFSLILSKGWRELHYISGVPGLTPGAIRTLEDKIVNKIITSDRNELDFRYKIIRNRPQLSGIVVPHTDGTATKWDNPEDRAEVEQWYRNYPDETPENEALPSRDMQKKDVMLWAKRGVGADYVQDGEGIDSSIKELLDYKPWIELRQDGETVVNDGMADPVKHL